MLTRPNNLDVLCAITAIDLSPDQAAQVKQLLAEVSDWQSLLSNAELYGVSNLLLRHIKAHSLSVPAPTMMQLRALAIRHSAAATARYELMCELTAAFAQHNLPFVGLKGVALAPMVYPADQLRPMRDIDILVPKGKTQLAAKVLREIGFDLPEQQPTKFMRDSHQLPNATKTVKGFTISVEIHHDALSRDVPDSLFYHQVEQHTQTVNWQDLQFSALGHHQMLHQVARHLTGLHPGAVLKMVNVLDVVLYAEKYREQIDWRVMKKSYAHVINTLRCLHLIVPLSPALQKELGNVQQVTVNGLGETMQPLSKIFVPQNSLKQKLKLLFYPPDWWLHLYYNVSPHKSLIWVHAIRHPLQVLHWLAKRAYSGILGG